MSYRQRIRVYIQDVWNKFDLTAITLFIMGVICRYTQLPRTGLLQDYAKTFHNIILGFHVAELHKFVLNGFGS